MDGLKINKLEKADIVPYYLLLSADPNKELVDEYLKSGECFVAKNGNNEIVGEYVLIRKSDEIFEIMNVAVDPDYQGKGIGKALILDAISRAKDYCAQKIEIGTGNSSFPQLALYQKCGFRIVGVYKNFFVDNYPEKIFENGIQCLDKIMLEIEYN
jgi:ribosomal protein S18 acetylase RimI-like enzyme